MGSRDIRSSVVGGLLEAEGRKLQGAGGDRLRPHGETYLGPDAAAVRLFHLHHVEALLTVIEFILEDMLKDYCDAGRG